MLKFQFPLEKALEWRSTRLRLENAKLAQLRHEKAALVQLSAELGASVQQAAQNMLSGSAALTGADLSNLATYREVIAARLKKLAVTLSQCDGRIQAQMKVVVAADREKQLLEKLKERQLEEWTYEWKREIENTAGELFLARWSN